MKVAILGAGNGGQTMACDLSIKGHEVHLYEMPQFAKNLGPLFETKHIRATGDFEGEADIAVVTTDIDEALDNAEIIFIALPSSTHRTYAELLAPRVKNGQVIVLMPGNLGSLVFKRIFKAKGVTAKVAICETSSLEYDTRVAEPCHVHVFARNPDLLFGVMPVSETDRAFDMATKLFTFQKVEDVIACGLHSLNPVLHLPGCTLNSARIERSKGDFYLYEEGITPCVARVMEAFDAEREKMVRELGYNYMSLAEELAEGREPRSIWEEVNGCETLEFIKGPTSLDNRYFTEDIPYGLTAWIELAEIIDIDVPVMKSLQAIGAIIIQQDPKAEGRNRADMGISGINDKLALRNYVAEL